MAAYCDDCTHEIRTACGSCHCDGTEEYCRQCSTPPPALPAKAGTCATCRFWRVGLYGPECDRIEIADERGADTARYKAELYVAVADDHGLEARLLTAPDFGCTLHETAEGREEAPTP